MSDKPFALGNLVAYRSHPYVCGAIVRQYDSTYFIVRTARGDVTIAGEHLRHMTDDERKAFEKGV